MSPALRLLLPTLIGAPLLALQAAEKPDLRDWMPRTEDALTLAWTEGPPAIPGVPFRPDQAVLAFRSGQWESRWDTRKAAPLGQSWECSVTVGTKRYHCLGPKKSTDPFRQPVRIVESGRFFSRVVLADLCFANEAGEELPELADLEISAWPDRLALRLTSTSPGQLQIRFGEKKASGSRQVSLLALGKESPPPIVESSLPSQDDPDLGSRVLSLPEIPWSNREGTYYPEEHLDRIDRWPLTLANPTDQPAVARLMFSQQKHLPITGFTPMLCEPDGTPTGLPIQISKNWHRNPAKGDLPHQGDWFHGFAYVRMPPHSRRELVLQMVYARFGGLPAASQAQLSLIGWGHNQFWDQIAVGSFGENICFEPGRVQRRCFITDLRPLMTLPQTGSKKKWGWSENAGGGDFLMWQDPRGLYQVPRDTRTDPRASGPCLTRTIYTEETPEGEISARMEVSVPQSEDYLRVFFRLRYDVHQSVRWSRLAFFQLGADRYNDVPARRLAVGDGSSLNQEWNFASDEIPAPFDWVGSPAWISVHGIDRSALKKGQAAAVRGLILRSWQAKLGGRAQPTPQISVVPTGGKVDPDRRLVVEISPPHGVSELLPGDFVAADLELIVLPAEAESYYGPDALFRSALQSHPDSWPAVQREATGNHLKISASQGSVRQTYPVAVAVDREQRAAFVLEGGVGRVPITFLGLDQPGNYRLTVNGEPVTDGQTDWEPESRQWSHTYLVHAPQEKKLEIVFGKTVPSP